MPTDQKTLDKLERDTKAQRFKEKYGRLMAVEVDALDALHPEVLKELIKKSVDDHYDPEIYKEKILKPYGSKEYKKQIDLETLEKLDKFREELVQRIEDDEYEDTEYEEPD